MSDEEVGWIIEPNHPAEKGEVLRRNIANGHQPVPGWSDHDMGTFMRGGHGPLHGARAHQGVYRATTPAPLRVRPFWLVLGLTGLVALFAAVVAVHG